MWCDVLELLHFPVLLLCFGFSIIILHFHFHPSTADAIHLLVSVREGKNSHSLLSLFILSVISLLSEHFSFLRSEITFLAFVVRRRSFTPFANARCAHL